MCPLHYPVRFHLSDSIFMLNLERQAAKSQRLKQRKSLPVAKYVSQVFLRVSVSDAT